MGGRRREQIGPVVGLDLLRHDPAAVIGLALIAFANDYPPQFDWRLARVPVALFPVDLDPYSHLLECGHLLRPGRTDEFPVQLFERDVDPVPLPAFVLKLHRHDLRLASDALEGG